jgi:hypothetical protein
MKVKAVQNIFVRYIVCLLLTKGLTSLSLCAQVNPFRVSASGWGMAQATVAHSDVWSVFTNVAGVGGQSQTAFLASYDSFFQVSGIHTLSVGALIPVSTHFASGVTVQRYGDSYLNEIIVGVGGGHSIERFSLGLKINYLQISMNSPSWMVSRKSVALEMGGIARFSSQFSVGAHAYNLTQSKYSDGAGVKVPTILKVGVLYLPVPAVMWSAEIEKNTAQPLCVKMGISYEVMNKVWLRTGLMANPGSYHFGLGLEKYNLKFDYAGQIHPYLGWSHHLSIAYLVSRKLDQY